MVDDGWQELGEYRMREKMIAVLRDWGTGLDLALYEQAAACLCGQPPNVESDVEVRMGDRLLGVQRMRLASPEAAIRVTALAPEWLGDFRAHLCRLLAHTDLRVIQWINVTRSSLQFRTIKKRKVKNSEERKIGHKNHAFFSSIIFLSSIFLSPLSRLLPLKQIEMSTSDFIP